MKKNKTSYVVKTNKGYLNGDIVQGVTFVEKEKARKFNYDEACACKQSIADDLFEFYNCEYMEFEKYK